MAGIAILPTAAAANTEEFLKACNAGTNLHRRIPNGRTKVIITPQMPNQNGATCADYTWVKLKGKIAAMNIQWKGRTTNVAGDCGHSTLTWGVYKKTSTSWAWVGGGNSYGTIPAGSNTCTYFHSSSNPPPWGAAYVPTGSTSDIEYRIAFLAWSHDENGGHGNYCADGTNCSWPVQFDITPAAAGWPIARQDWVIWRPVNGSWYFSDSASGSTITQQWGQSGDRIVPGDFDGDYGTDFAVSRITASERMWYVINSSTGNWWQSQWGLNSDTPLKGADFDGDGRADVSVYRVTATRQQWISIGSNHGSTILVDYTTDISSGDRVVVGDYDNDLRTDRALWRSSTGRWRIGKSFSGGINDTIWGVNGDHLIAPDFDGDYSTDIAVWRPSNGTFYWIDSADGQGWQRQWGQNND
ncbi:MAG TPA: hypothetical protein VGF45_20765, partial [Polyangia bacterium]